MAAAIGAVRDGSARCGLVDFSAYRRKLLIAVSALMMLVAVVLSSRRIAGALVEPLPAIAMFVVGLLGLAAAASVRTLRLPVVSRFVLSIGFLLLASSVSLPGSSWWGLSVLWLLVILQAGLLWRPSFNFPDDQRFDVAWRHANPQNQLSAATPPTTSSPDFLHAELVANIAESSADWTDSAATQHLKYSRTVENGMVIEGWLRVEFISGQRIATVHAAFCPAFGVAPQIEAEPLDGPDCEIRTTLALPWGSRWEVKLDQPAPQPTSVIVGFIATGSSPS